MFSTTYEGKGSARLPEVRFFNYCYCEVTSLNFCVHLSSPEPQITGIKIEFLIAVIRGPAHLRVHEIVRYVYKNGLLTFQNFGFIFRGVD